MCLDILGACVIGAQLTGADIGYTTDMPTTAYSYDGTERQIGQFYEDEQTNFYIEGEIYLRDNWKITVGYDNGIDTAKYDKAKSYTLGATHAMKLSGNNPTQPIDYGHYLTVGVQATFGGETRHTACVDSYNREYYCGNLTAFSDFEQPEHKMPASMGVTYTYKF